MKDKLTEKQENFLQNILKGMSQKDAYMKAYDVSETTKMNTVYNSASMLLIKPKVAQRLAKLKDKVEKKVIEELVYTRLQSFKEFERAQKIALNLDEKISLGRIDLSSFLKAEEQKGKLAELYKQSIELTRNVYSGILDKLDGKDDN